MIRQEQDYETEDFEVYDVTCGNACGHYDYLNQCCWLSWRNKQEGDYCNYGLKEVDGMVYTPKELEQLRNSSRSMDRNSSGSEGS